MGFPVLKFPAGLRRRLEAVGLSGVLVALVSFGRKMMLESKIVQQLKERYRYVLAREDLGTLYDYRAVKNLLGS